MKKTFILLTVINGLVAPMALADGPRGFDLQAIDADSSGTISAAEVAAFHEARFTQADANGDGMIDANEIVALVPLRDGASSKRQERRAARLTRHLDTNEDGAISLAEFSADERQDRLFARLDRDGDGTLSAEEIAKVQERMNKRGGKRGGKKQRGGDGAADRI